MDIARIGVVAKPHLDSVADELRQLLSALADRSIDVVLDIHAAAVLGDNTLAGIERDEIPEAVDLVVVLGGDGTLLSVARFAARAGVPVLGVNYGGLGFLTSTPREELVSAAIAVIEGRFTAGKRRLLRAEVSGPERDAPLVEDVLNDAVINKSDLARIVELSVSVNGELVSGFASDGMIIASATGSTAYSLAAGGPIVMPEVDALVMTPICPHTLTNRPVVLPGDAVLEIRQVSVDQQIILTLDGQVGIMLDPGETVTVRRSPLTLRLVRSDQRSYFDVLRAKLRWGGR